MNKTTLGDITLSIFDGKHGDCEDETNSGFYFISVKDLRDYGIDYSNARQITESDFSAIYSRTNLENGDTVYANTGYIGKSHFVKSNHLAHKTAFQKSVAVLKPNVDKVDPRYLYFLMKNETERLKNAAAGSNQKNLLLATMRNFEVKIHDMEVQKKIVKILGTIDDAIINNTLICKQLEEMAGVMFDYWFTQFDFPDENGNPYRASGGKMVWNDQLKREIPEGWEVGKMSDLMTVVRGVSYKPTDVENESDIGFVPLLKSNNIQDGKINYNCIYIPSSLVSESQYLDKGSVFITMSSGSTAHVGKTARVAYDTQYAFGAFCAKIKPKSEFCSFVTQFYLSDYFAKKIRTIINGTNIKNIGEAHLSEIETAIPQARVLLEFEKKMRTINGILGNLEQNTLDLAALRDFLLPLLMNGQVWVQGTDYDSM